MAFMISKPDTAFRNDGRRARKKQPRERAEAHLAFIRTLPCLVTGKTPVEAAHVRYGDARYGKPKVGMAEKPDDHWAVPLSPDEHRRQHSMNERAYWQSVGIDPVLVASLLWSSTGKVEAAMQIIQHARRNRETGKPVERN